MPKIVDDSLLQVQLLEEAQKLYEKLARLKAAYAQRMPYAINGLILRRIAKSNTIEHSA